MAPVRLDADDVADYYGHARQTLWPIYHDLVRPATYLDRWCDAYRRVNRAFAESVAKLAVDGATVWVNDYHLQLVPALLRRLRPDLRIGFFLHTGFPSPDLFMRIPMRQEIVQGLLGADLVGFQTATAAENFLRLTHQFSQTPHSNSPSAVAGAEIGVFPTAADTEAIARLVAMPSVNDQAVTLREDLGRPTTVVLSLDTADEASGIERRLEIIGEMLASADIRATDVAFIQIVSDDRDTTPGGGALRDRIGREIARINGQFATVGRPCVHYLVTSPNLAERVALYRAADIMIATPLREATSLPALEYVAANGDGALILSEFSGTAAALRQAFLVNPYDANQVKSMLVAAVTATPAELRQRMDPMRRYVGTYDNHVWAASFLNALDSAPACTPIHGRHSRPRKQKPRLGQRPAGPSRRGGP